MRFRLPLGRRALLIAAFALALLVTFPMRVGLDWFGMDEAGLSARAVDGSIWHGRLAEARISAMPLGDVRAGLSPVQLFVGRARVDVGGRSGSEPLKGAIGVTRNSLGFDDVTAKLQAGDALAPLPIGSIDLTDLSVRFQGAQCANASGRVRANLQGAIGGVTLAGGLTGNARCEGGALLLPLVGESGMEQVTLRIARDGRYRAEIAVRQPDGPGFSQMIEGRL